METSSTSNSSISSVSTTGSSINVHRHGSSSNVSILTGVAIGIGPNRADSTRERITPIGAAPGRSPGPMGTKVILDGARSSRPGPTERRITVAITTSSRRISSCGRTLVGGAKSRLAKSVSLAPRPTGLLHPLYRSEARLTTSTSSCQCTMTFDALAALSNHFKGFTSLSSTTRRGTAKPWRNARNASGPRSFD